MTDTKERILNSAERLISERGYAATSLRHIIADADVNLAAIHYHFGSKEGLLDEVVLRRARPVNEARLAMLERFEGESAGPLSVEQILEAFMRPMAEAAADSMDFVRLIGRMHAEGMMPVLAQRHFQPVVVRFLAAFRRALPALPDEELAWRAHFMIGAMAHAVCCKPLLATLAPDDFRRRFARLIAFLSGGFRAEAPVLPALAEVEVEK